MFRSSLKVAFWLIAVVVVEGIIAFFDQTLTLGQMKARWPNITSFIPFTRHGGMYGDVLIVPWVVGRIMAYHEDEVRHINLKFFGSISAMIGVFCMLFWAQQSDTTYDSFSRGGHTIVNGYIHIAYLIFCLMLILVYFMALRPTSFREVTLISFSLIAHLGLGLLEPAYVAHGRVPKPIILTFLILSAILILLWSAKTSSIRRRRNY